MSDARGWLSEVEERANTATKGEWKPDWLDSGNSTYCVVAPASVVGGFGAIARTSREKRGWENAEFIAAARSDVPRLCALVRTLGEALALLPMDGLRKQQVAALLEYRTARGDDDD